LIPCKCNTVPCCISFTTVHLLITTSTFVSFISNN
jgi:hypothetical protein